MVSVYFATFTSNEFCVVGGQIQPGTRKIGLRKVLKRRSDTHMNIQTRKEFVPHVQTSEKMAKETYAMFNNCHRGNAMRNAEKMKVMLKG